MGYETKIIVVQKHSRISSISPKIFAEKIAEFNLCKLDYNGPYMGALANFRATDCYIYSDDGDTQILEDKYGDELKEIELRPLIKILKKENQSYQRIPVVISMLTGILYGMKDYKNIVALHYGY